MRLDRRGVDENLRGRPAGLRERVEQVDPDAFGGPADIAIVERLLRPVFRRRVDPAAAGFQHMDDAADHAPIVDPRLAARVGGKMRRDLRKLLVRQPELIGNHRRFLSEAVNHNAALMPTTLWVRTLGMLNVVDEFTRECLAIRVTRKLNSMDVIDALSDLFILRGVPGYIHSDNGRSLSPSPCRPGSRASAPRPPTSHPAHHGRTEASRRAAEWRGLLLPQGGAGRHRRLATALQRGASACFIRQSAASPGGSVHPAAGCATPPAPPGAQPLVQTPEAPLGKRSMINVSFRRISHVGRGDWP